VDHDRHQLVGRVRNPVAVEAEHIGRILHRPEDRPGEHDRPHGMQAELELGDDAEVPAAAAEAPEEI
jgi:hypothetical protein